MRRLLYLVSILSLLTMCSQENKKIEYYSNGNIKSEWFPDIELLLEYNEEGNLIVKQWFKNGKHHGFSESYYNNGSLKSKECFINNKCSGWASYYKRTGILEVKRHFILVDTVSYLNEVIFFNEKGDTLKEKSNYFTLKVLKDTVAIGEEFILTIQLNAPYFNDKMAVFISYFDSLYYLPDTALGDLRAGNNFIVNYNFSPKNKGSQYIRGFISDYTIIKEDTSEYTDERLLYFSKKFFVK